jgi:arginine decarboxylase
VLVPGQVFSQQILSFMRALDTPEIHGYRADLGYRVYVDKALEIAAPGANSRPEAALETVPAATTSQAPSSKAKRRTEAPG